MQLLNAEVFLAVQLQDCNRLQPTAPLKLWLRYERLVKLGSAGCDVALPGLPEDLQVAMLLLGQCCLRSQHSIVSCRSSKSMQRMSQHR